MGGFLRMNRRGRMLKEQKAKESDETNQEQWGSQRWQSLERRGIIQARRMQVGLRIESTA
jgi:hypothetical protein